MADPGFQPEWPEEIRLKVWIKHEDDGLYGAMVEQFCIAGQGGTPDEALADARDLTISYLNSFVEEGASYADAYRPIPRSLRWKFHAENLFSKVRFPKMPIPWVQVRESDAPLHPC